jgi:hypothetical protein
LRPYGADFSETLYSHSALIITRLVDTAKHERRALSGAMIFSVATGTFMIHQGRSNQRSSED